MVDKPVLQRIEQVLFELSRYVADTDTHSRDFAAQEALRREADHVVDADSTRSERRLAAATAWIRIRQARDKAFGSGLFSDPAWAILLDLYVGRYRRHPVSITSAAHAANVPASTGVRWVAMLEKAGLVERDSDPVDRRRILVSLTDTAIDLIDRLFDRLDAGDADQ